MAISEKTLGPEHPATAASLNNLAVLLHDQGDYAGARPLYERALAIREKALGPEHPATATSFSYLAALLSLEGVLSGHATAHATGPVQTAMPAANAMASGFRMGRG